VLQLDDLSERLDEGQPVGLVSIMLASNETGVMQPIDQIAALCRSAGVPLHTDAVQAVGKIEVNFRQLGVTALSFTAHKFHGPVGIGGLLLRPEASLKPLLYGGHQQSGLRAGTESAALTSGMLAALEAWSEEREARPQRIALLRDQLEQSVQQENRGVVLLGAGAIRAPHTSCIAFPGADRQALVMAYDLAGVACATGSACASGSSEPSSTLLAMGFPDELVRGAVRFSLGATTTAEQIELAVERIGAVNRSIGPVSAH
jgi:cysteine desulfurase